MARNQKSRLHRDEGLSEVIGFVIIFGIIVVVFANYMLYGIPAQGRDNEIAHMNDIKDQFVDYKIGLDSLFNNNKIGTTLSDSFTLGAGGSYSTGMNSLIPIMSPVKSGGTIAINQRTTEPETLTISSQSLIQSTSARSAIDFPASGTQLRFNYTPSHIYVNISDIGSGDLAQGKIFGATVNGSTWIATINITPQYSTYQNYTYDDKSGTHCPISPDGPSVDLGNDCLVPHNNLNYDGSDLTITISKSNLTTMQGYAVYKNVTFTKLYTIDLMDDSYGLKSFIQPPGNISLVKDKTQGNIKATGNITYGFTEMNPYTITPIPLGALEYRAQNNYWISQDYYYQLGGIFIAQDDGNSTYKLPPEITFSNDTAKNIVTVNINALVFDPNSHGIVGGNSPVQIKTTLMSNNAL
ncbi:MAG: hypothetical protein NTZ39_06555, partial [Methanoregula sp.]|nr:hypothetical protein [Methanoregula sp.]